jgi:hypothetical protein
LDLPSGRVAFPSIIQKFFKKKLEYGREKKKQKIAVDHGDQEKKQPLAKIQAI